jgi:hypothetical protein
MSNVRINLTTKPQIQYYQHREDKEVFGYIRPCAVGGCPAVFVLLEPQLKVEMTKDWQYYLIAINYGMALVDISAILDYRLAFANGTGLTKPDQPRRDYILEKNLNSPENPKLDKDRTCSRSILTGIEVGDYLKLNTMDGNNPPPMKPGKPRPQTIAEIRIEDYLYNPRENREMFLVANTVSVKEKGNTSVAPFPRGAIYDWTKDNLPYTFLPHVSRQVIYYSLKNLIKIPLGNTIPSPYRIYP